MHFSAIGFCIANAVGIPLFHDFIAAYFTAYRAFAIGEPP
jgi:hypothetical protein